MLRQSIYSLYDCNLRIVTYSNEVGKNFQGDISLQAKRGDWRIEIGDYRAIISNLYSPISKMHNLFGSSHPKLTAAPNDHKTLSRIHADFAIYPKQPIIVQVVCLQDHNVYQATNHAVAKKFGQQRSGADDEVSLVDAARYARAPVHGANVSLAHDDR